MNTGDKNKELNNTDKKLHISDIISSKNHLTKDEIISTGDWYEAELIFLTMRKYTEVVSQRSSWAES